MFIDNRSLVPYTTGTIQMVPGMAGYEVALRKDDSGEMGLMYSPNKARYNRTRMLDEMHQTTYTEYRRLKSYGMTGVGSFIDIYA